MTRESRCGDQIQQVPPVCCIDELVYDFWSDLQIKMIQIITLQIYYYAITNYNIINGLNNYNWTILGNSLFNVVEENLLNFNENCRL